MTEWNMIGDNKNNNEFHFDKYFYQLVIVNNQDIFDI